MKLHFDANQPYQQDAIGAVVRVFEGQPPGGEPLDFAAAGGAEKLFGEAGFANRLLLSEEQILRNVQIVQDAHGLPRCEALDGMNFSVEMETGTGKTYVYLRTIYELNAHYGFRKFVIVVPSVAIREGVLKNLRITHDHLQNLYGRPPVNFAVYDSKRVSGLRNFALGDSAQIMVINIDSFAKDANIINRHNDKLMGEKPLDFVSRACPVVIVDEPQNMETPIRRRAIEALNPLCTLRYSATHTSRYNLVYSLNPVQAFNLGLVKQIEVSSVIAPGDFNAAYIRLKGVKAAKSKISARVEIDCNASGGVKRKTVSAELGDDLHMLSGRREAYQNGCIVNEISLEGEFIQLSNGIRLEKGQAHGGSDDSLMKSQIGETVREHFAKERSLREKGIKVLSLFFIDRVASYRGYDELGNPVPGKIAGWLEEAFWAEAQKPENAGVIPFEADEIHDGYFSKDPRGKWKDTRGESQADGDAFQLIMKDKERLLDPAIPLRFIFSHSALREGWDNPNVFQICTLNETRSELKKRQEIGRGLRLAVDREGNRVHESEINRLTVIANERYEDFARQLQTEINHEFGGSFNIPVRNKENRRQIKYRKGFQLDEQFKAIWDKISYRTSYSVKFDTGKLAESAAEAVRGMGPILRPSIQIEKAGLQFADKGIETTLKRAGHGKMEHGDSIPDVLFQIQERVRLTRSTIHLVLLQSGRLSEALLNPQMFVDLTSAAINSELKKLMVDGIQYEKIGSEVYEMRLFEETEFYVNDHTFHVQSPEKTIYSELIPLDSGVENQFARDCESMEDIEFYFKLPSWFKIMTPIGPYNPDWALVKKNEKTIYFVAETKSKGQELRPSEQMKIHCGEMHFREGSDVEYRCVSSVSELI